MSRMAVWFKETVQVYRRASNTAWVAASYESVGEVKCFIQPGSGAMGTTSGAVMPNATYTLYCPHDAPIRMGDKIIDVYGRSFTVTSAPLDRGVAGIKDHMEVLMELQNA